MNRTLAQTLKFSATLNPNRSSPYIPLLNSTAYLLDPFVSRSIDLHVNKTNGNCGPLSFLLSTYLLTRVTLQTKSIGSMTLHDLPAHLKPLHHPRTNRPVMSSISLPIRQWQSHADTSYSAQGRDINIVYCLSGPLVTDPPLLVYFIATSPLLHLNGVNSS